MSATGNQQHTFPAAPPSPSADEHEMRDYYAAQDAPRPPSDQTLYLTPYLGLRARLSQVWINRWTILILLVLVRTLLAIASLDSNLTSARKQALSACTSVEKVGSAMASMPHYMSDGVNDLTADGIEKAINGLKSMLVLSITGVEEIVLFIINLLTSTYVCLITFAVGGSLHAAIEVAQYVGNALNSTVQDVGKDLASAVSGFDHDLNTFLKGIDSVGSALSGKSLTPPTIDLNSSVSKLDSLQLPPDYDADLSKLNASIPTFAQVQNFTNNNIRFPFEELKKQINESLGTYTMNRSLFPVPQKEELTFCSDNESIQSFFDGLVHIEHLAQKIFLVVLIVLAILACIPMAYREIRRWRFMKDRAVVVRDSAVDPLDAVYLVSRPYTSSAGIFFAKPFSLSRTKTLIRWTVAYATTVPALFVLSLGVAGLLGCLTQYILLKAIEKEVPVLENEVVGFSDKVVNALNNASEQWAVGANGMINKTNHDINTNLLGWVNVSTTALNDTLNVFVNETYRVLNQTFGGTVLYDPVTEVLNCLVMLKIQGIEKALTWISDNAHVDLSTIPIDTFSLGTLQKVKQAGNGSILAAGNGDTATNDVNDAINHVTNFIAKAIRQEAIISTCVVLIWVLIVLVGLFRAAYLIFGGGRGGLYQPPPLSPNGRGLQTDQIGGFLDTKASQDSIRVPTYEQAVGNTGGSDANRYHGQTYTLAPRPFTSQLETLPVLTTGFNGNEKVGQVGSQNVESATHRPAHIRASSYGNLVLTSPVDALPPTSNNKRKSNYLQVPPDPFVDPGP